MFGQKCFVVGLEDDDDGSVRVYVGARVMNLHTHVEDPQSVAELREAWATAKHVLIDAPPADALCGCRQAIEPIPTPAPRCGSTVTLWPDEEDQAVLTCGRPAGHDNGLPAEIVPHEDTDGNRWWGSDVDSVVMA